MQSKEFYELLKVLEEERGIKKEIFIEALESGLTAAYKKIYGEAKSATVKLNPEKNSIKIYSYKTVVENVEDPDKEISLEDARLIKKSYKIGDEVVEEENIKNFGRIPSQTVRHVLMQKIREVTKEREYNELTQKVDSLITVQVMRFENGIYFLNLGGVEAEGILSARDCIPGENIQVHSKIRVLVKRINDNPRGCQIQCVRNAPAFVARIFELEIPEIASKEVEIKAISREAGFRTKIALQSNTIDLDAVGACIGNRGARINSIISELNGEKIDLFYYSEDPKEFIANALKPAEVIDVTIDEENKSSLAIVPDSKLSLAIGKEGKNVKLASRVTGWKIDVKSVSQISNAENAEETQDLYEISDEEIFGEIEE